MCFTNALLVLENMFFYYREQVQVTCGIRQMGAIPCDQWIFKMQVEYAVHLFCYGTECLAWRIVPYAAASPGSVLYRGVKGLLTLLKANRIQGGSNT